MTRWLLLILLASASFSQAQSPSGKNGYCPILVDLLNDLNAAYQASDSESARDRLTEYFSEKERYIMLLLDKAGRGLIQSIPPELSNYGSVEGFLPYYLAAIDNEERQNIHDAFVIDHCGM